jgi:hypothetical protein
MDLTTACTVVRDRGFEPLTPTVSRYTGLLEAYSFSVGDSTWSHANPCRNEKCYSEMLRWLSADNLKLLPADETDQLSGAPLKDRKGVSSSLQRSPKGAVPALGSF